MGTDLIEQARERSWYHTLELPAGLRPTAGSTCAPYVDRYRCPSGWTACASSRSEPGTASGPLRWSAGRRGRRPRPRRRARRWTGPRAGGRRRSPRGVRGAASASPRSCWARRSSASSAASMTPCPRTWASSTWCFCGTVIIHLRDQLLALERIAGLTKPGGPVHLGRGVRPVAVAAAVPVSRYQADRPKDVVFWIPNARCWRRMLWSAGFDEVDEQPASRSTRRPASRCATSCITAARPRDRAPRQSELRAESRELEWYHTLELAPGLVTPGWFDLRTSLGNCRCPPRWQGCAAWTSGPSTASGRSRWSAAARRGHRDRRARPGGLGLARRARGATVAAIGKRKARGRGFELARGGAGLDGAAPRALGLRPRPRGRRPLRLRLRGLAAAASARPGARARAGALGLLGPAAGRRRDRPRRLRTRRPAATLDGIGRPWWWKPNAAGFAQHGRGGRVRRSWRGRSPCCCPPAPASRARRRGRAGRRSHAGRDLWRTSSPRRPARGRAARRWSALG